MDLRVTGEGGGGKKDKVKRLQGGNDQLNVTVCSDCFIREVTVLWSISILTQKNHSHLPSVSFRRCTNLKI